MLGIIMESYERQRRNLITISLIIIVFILANGQIKSLFGVTSLDKEVINVFIGLGFIYSWWRCWVYAEHSVLSYMYNDSLELIELKKDKDNFIHAKDVDKKFLEYITNKNEEKLGEHRSVTIERFHINRINVGEWNIHTRYTEGDRINQKQDMVFKNEWGSVGFKLMRDTLFKKSSFSDYMLPHLIAISCLLMILIKSTDEWTGWMTDYYSFIKSCQLPLI